MPIPYAENPRLTTVEILSWAMRMGVFTLSDVIKEFGAKYKAMRVDEETGKERGSKDPVHDASERIRKLIKSGMLVVVTAETLPDLAKPVPKKLEEDIDDTEFWDPLLTKEEVKECLGRIDEVLRVHSVGRKPRFYLMTRQGKKYTEKRESNIQNEAAKGHRKKGK